MNDSTAAPQPEAAPPPLRLTVPAQPSSVGEVRSLVARYLDSSGIGDDTYYDALLVASELTANAVTHGSKSGDSIEITCKIAGPVLCLCVLDAARGGAPVPLTPDAARATGRGLQLIERIAADWSERIVGGRREVRAELRLH